MSASVRIIFFLYPVIVTAQQFILLSQALSTVGGLKTKSGASSVSGGNTLEETLCSNMMRLKIRATIEILRSMFLSHDQALGAIAR
jgi:hypothetical protein